MTRFNICSILIGDDQRVTDLSPCLRDLVADVRQLRRASIRTASDHGRRLIIIIIII